MRYSYDRRVRDHRRTWRKVRRVLLVCALLVGLALGTAAVFFRREIAVQPVAIAGREETYIVAASSGKTVSNEYFTFTSMTEWAFDGANSQLPNKYVYNAKNGSNIERTLTIYRAFFPPQPQLTRIMPVAIRSTAVEPAAMSPRCGNKANYRGNPMTETYQDISFTCMPDSTQYLAAAGHKGGGLLVPVPNAHGGSKPFMFLYRDSTLSPIADPFAEVLKSFKSR